MAVCGLVELKLEEYIMRRFLLIALGCLAFSDAVGQGFYAVSRVTAMAPARGGGFFGLQGLGPAQRRTPTTTTYQTLGPTVARKTTASPTQSTEITRLRVAGIRQRAMAGSVVDQYRMGVVMVRGTLGRPDLEGGKHWFELAARHNYAPAKAALAHLEKQRNLQ